jgi:uncharacterized protein (DUF488 family)
MSKLKKIFTVGYEGKTITELIKQLKQQKIKFLVDVRINANSRKRDFAKTKLSENLNKNGIKYEHHKSLGTPKELMEVMKKEGHYSMEEYGDFLDKHIEVIHDFASHVNDNRLALMCYERNFSDCHRSVVADRLSKVTKAKVVHL